jgi:hypothetical protein
MALLERWVVRVWDAMWRNVAVAGTAQRWRCSNAGLCVSGTQCGNRSV